MSRYFPKNNNTSLQSALIRTLSLLGCWGWGWVIAMVMLYEGTGSVFVCVFSNKSWQSLSEDCNVLSEKWEKCSDKLFLFSIHLISLFSQIFISCASQTYLIICQRRKWIRKLFLHFYQFVSVSNLSPAQCRPNISPFICSLWVSLSQWAHTWLGQR